ncbi:MAG: hypothetical protein LBR98_03590 [Syntrophomonadaceae bacterium]|jgi:hypothetical protein|nr:hypothetical protein [Syntrophomonadaceae bacterium]
MIKNTKELINNLDAVYALFPEGWKEKAREPGALKRARKTKAAEDLLMLNLLYQTNGKSLAVEIIGGADENGISSSVAG